MIDIRTRVLTARIIEKMERQNEYSQALGITNISRYRCKPVNNDKIERKY